MRNINIDPFGAFLVFILVVAGAVFLVAGWTHHNPVRAEVKDALSACSGHWYVTDLDISEVLQDHCGPQYLQGPLDVSLRN